MARDDQHPASGVGVTGPTRARAPARERGGRRAAGDGRAHGRELKAAKRTKFADVRTPPARRYSRGATRSLARRRLGRAHATAAHARARGRAARQTRRLRFLGRAAAARRMTADRAGRRRTRHRDAKMPSEGRADAARMTADRLHRGGRRRTRRRDVETPRQDDGRARCSGARRRRAERRRMRLG